MSRGLKPAASLALLTLAACAAPVTGPAASSEPAARSGSSSAASSSPSPVGSSTPSTPSSTTLGACHTKAAGLSLPAKAGQLFMMGVQAGTPASTTISDLGATQVGSIILLGDRTGGVSAVRAETEAISGQFPGVLIATDQEGGLVQRLSGPGFSAIPAASDQASSSPEQLRADWANYGAQLRSAGVHYDLAPVADVVPADEVALNEPIGQLDRGYGSQSDAVAGKVTAVIAGLSDAKIASSVKHFPGLGRVQQNTDFAVGHDALTTRGDAQLIPFRQAIDADVDSVMVSSAIYDRIDPDNPAVFSKLIVTDILRGELGFKGVVISDDLGAAKSVAAVDPGQRGVRFFQAGGDLLISADPALVTQMIDATVAQAEADPAFAAGLDEKATRVLELKKASGLPVCQ